LVVEKEFQAYPKWKYHAKKGAVIVKNEAEEAALGRGWQDTPFDPEVVEIVHPAEVELTAVKAEHDALVTELNALVNEDDTTRTLRELIDQLKAMKAANTQE
jgi:hypothetical protein